MGLLFLQTTNSTSDLATYTFVAQNIGTAAAERQIIVLVVGRKTGATTSISSMTVGGVAATIAVQRSNNVTNTNVAGIAIANVPTGTTGDVVVTFGAGMVRCGIGVWRADNLLSATASDTDSSVANDPSVTLDVPNYGFIIGGGCTAASTGATWTGLNEKYDAVIESALTHSGASQEFATGQTGRTLTEDFGTSSESAGVFASWQQNAPNFVPRIRIV